MYRIITDYGTLNDWYRVCDLEPYAGVLNVEISDYETKKVSLTEAARLQGCRTGSVEMVNAVCNCNVEDKRCKCWKLRKKCTSHCHFKLVTGKNKKKGVCKNF